MAKPKALKIEEFTAPKPQPDEMTGVAFSIQASSDLGFSNYRICTLFIIKGQIVHIEKSQEFAGFEAIARTEILVNSSLWNLSSRYEPGVYQSLGGDKRDELMKLLKKTDQELLKKIAPALHLPEGSV